MSGMDFFPPISSGFFGWLEVLFMVVSRHLVPLVLSFSFLNFNFLVRETPTGVLAYECSSFALIVLG
jgi:hypothetical protein